MFYIFGTIAIWYQSNIMLQSTQGVILSMFLTSGMFFFYLFINTIKVYKREKNLTNLNSLIMYGYAVIAYTIYSIIYLYNSDRFMMKLFDYINLILILLSIIIIYFLNISLSKVLPSIVKVIPQLVFTITILIEGNNGVSEVLIISFHFITLPRLFYNFIIFKENKTDENKFMFISELLNEVSWILVTIAYYLVWIWILFHIHSFFISKKTRKINFLGFLFRETMLLLFVLFLEQNQFLILYHQFLYHP